jgi:hypothetical protein
LLAHPISSRIKNTWYARVVPGECSSSHSIWSWDWVPLHKLVYWERASGMPLPYHWHNDNGFYALVSWGLEVDYDKC